MCHDCLVQIAEGFKVRLMLSNWNLYSIWELDLFYYTLVSLEYLKNINNSGLLIDLKTKFVVIIENKFVRIIPKNLPFIIT